MIDKAIVLLSGGMDSLVCIAEAAKEAKELFVLHMTYGQKTQEKELQCFNDIADHYNIPSKNRKVFDMSFLQNIGGSSLTDSSIKVAHYEGDSDIIPTSYVPFRNTLILSIAVSWGEVLGANALYFGANYEDSPGYPDCRPEYYETFNELIKKGTKEGLLKVVTPVLRLNKKEIVLKATELHAPLELTWSCYASGDLACGVCDSCALRLRGFQQAGLMDPLPYKK